MKRFTALLLSGTLILGSLQTVWAENAPIAGEEITEQLQTESEEVTGEIPAEVNENEAGETQEAVSEEGFTEEALLSFDDIEEISFDLRLGDYVSVYLDEGEHAYFKFIPDEDGIYTFYTEIGKGSYGYDSYGVLYDADGDELDRDDEGGSDSNFAITKYLYAGEEYYLEAYSYYDDEAINLDVYVIYGEFYEEPDSSESTIITHPIYDSHATYGTSSLLRVEAESLTDGPLEYAWFKYNDEIESWEDIIGAYSDEYTTDPADMIRPQVTYLCQVTDGSDFADCYFSLDIEYLQSFGSGDVQIKSGDQATFTAYVAENVTGESYTWFEVDDDGFMEELDGENDSSLTVGIGSPDSKKTYICRITSGEFSEDVEFCLYSQGSLRTIYSYYHEMGSMNEKDLCVYAFSAKKDAAISYQWQKSVSSDDRSEEVFEDIPGANAATYKVRVSDLKDMSTRYRCVVSDGSQEADCTMEVYYLPFDYALSDGDGNIIQGNTCTVPSNKAATVRVNASSSISGPVSYQWQQYGYNESTWNYEYIDIPGETSPTFTVSKEEIAERHAEGRNWLQYYCVISCGEFSYQIPVYLGIEDIQYEHGVRWINLTKGESAVVMCDAVSTSGEPLEYQWYCFDEKNQDEDGYLPIAGATEAEYTVDSTMLTGSLYTFYCEVKTASMDEPVTCSWVTVKIESDIYTEWNYNYYTFRGSSLFLHADAVSLDGKELSYQWYEEDSYGSKTAIPGATDSVYIFNTEDLEDMDEEITVGFGCEISDGTDRDYYNTRVVVLELSGWLEEGETKNFYADNAIHYVCFAPEEDGTYVFESSGNANTSVNVYSSTGNHAYDRDDAESNFRIRTKLNAGEIYFLELRGYTWDDDLAVFGVNCSFAGNDDPKPEFNDQVEYLSAYFMDQVLLDPEFQAIPGASFQWWIAKNERYNDSRFYQITGATGATYTTDWTDINGKPMVHTDNSAYIRGCMYDADGQLVDYKTYCVSFNEFHAVADNEGAYIMAEGDTRTFTVDVPHTLGKNLSYRWMLVTADGYGVHEPLDCYTNKCTFTMDRSYAFNLRCAIEGDCDSELVDFFIIPEELNEIQSVSLSLLENGNLGLNYYVTGNERLLYTFDGGELQPALSTVEVIESEDLDDSWGAQRKYTYRITKELSSAQMADDVTLDLYYGLWEGDTYALDLSYTISVAEYADWILADSEYSEYWPIVRSMINYGTAAQKYFGYNTDKPAADQVTHMTAAQKKVTDLTAAQLDGYGRNIPEGAEGLTYYGSSLVLSSEIMLRHYFTLEEGYEIFDYGFFVNGRALKAKAKAGLYYVDVPAGAFGSYDDAISLSIYTEDEVTRIDYSVRDYIAKAYSCADREFKNLLNTIW